LWTYSGTALATLSQMKSALLGASAYLSSIASNPKQFASNVSSGAQLVRSNPVGVATAMGSGMAQGVSKTVNDLYYGDDATQDQALASTIIFFGSLPASELAAGKLATVGNVLSTDSKVAEVATKVHANSLSYKGTSYGYTLRDIDTGAIGKFGETINPNTRYTKKWLRENNLYMQVEMSGTKLETHEWQHQSILDFKEMTSTTPLFNKTNW
jgi:hypothetical protein